MPIYSPTSHQPRTYEIDPELFQSIHQEYIPISHEDLPEGLSFVNEVPNSPIKDDYNKRLSTYQTYLSNLNLTSNKVYKSPLNKVYFTDKKDFISKMLPLYENYLSSIGKDKSYAKYLVAQSGLESGWGSSELSSKYNNLGGIKDFSNKDSVSYNTKEYNNGKLITKKQPFRKFANLDDYVKYHVNLLNSSRYDAFSDDFLSAVDGKYATDINYKEKLLSIIKGI